MHAFLTLAGLLRGEPPALPLTEPQWLTIVHAANDHRVLRVFTESTKTLDLRIPLSAASLIQAYKRESVGFSLLQIAEVAKILSSAVAVGLRVIPLKGPVLLQRFYGDPVRRHSSDLDLLVPEPECAGLGAVLAALGYREQFSGESVKSQWVRGPVMIEVHTHFDEPVLLPFSMGPVWERARCGSFQGQSCWHLHPSDELLFLSLHAARHGFQQLSWPLELARAYELFATELPLTDGRWQPLSGQEATPLPGILLLGHAMAQRVSARAVPSVPVNTPARVRRRAVQLVDEFWDAALHGEALHANRLRAYRYLLRLEPSAAGRARGLARQLWMCSTRHTSIDLEIAERWRVRSRLGRWMLRQAYLLGKLVGGRDTFARR